MDSTSGEICFVFFLWSCSQIAIISPFYIGPQQGTVFRTFQGKSFAGCKFECITKKKCIGFNYRRHLGFCMLLEESYINHAYRDPRITSGAKIEWKQDFFDTRCIETCSDKETCYIDRDAITCTLEECVYSPHMVGNITQLGNLRQIGSIILYNCHGKEEITGSDLTSSARNECKTDGDWLYKNITCMEKDAILYSYKGCFLDKPERALHAYTLRDATMTISMCAIFCHEKDQKYFGLEHFAQCYCDTKMKYEVPVTNCNTPCRGDQTTFCGGTWALGVYTFISH